MVKCVCYCITQGPYVMSTSYAVLNDQVLVSMEFYANMHYHLNGLTLS